MTEVATLGLRVDGAPVDKASDSLGRFEKSAERAEHAASDMGRGVSRAGKQSEASLARVERASNAVAGSFRLVTAALTAAASGFGVGRLVSETANFEQSLLGLQVVSGATATQMKELEAQSRSLGATSVFTAQQAADAQNFLAMAGFEVNEVLGATPGVLELAAAGSLDLASAADLASNVLGGFRLETEELGRVNDVLASAAANSNTNIQQLGQALSYAAPIAAAAGVSIEETAAAVGVLSDAGLQGSRAGTGLLGVIRQLSNLTPAATEALASYGLTAEEVNIENEGLATVLQRLGDAGINAADAFKIFGSEAGPAAQILASGAVRVNEFTGELELADGAARRAALTLSSGLQGSFKALSSAVGESTLQLGRDSGLSSALQDVIGSVTGVISVYNGMLDEFSEANDLTDDQASNLQTVAGALSAAAGAAGSLGAAYVATTVATWGFHAAQKALNAVVRANPYVIAASALVALTGALYNARNATVTLGDTSVRVKDWIQAGWIEASDTLVRSTGSAIDAATGFFGTFGDSVSSVAEYLWGTFRALMGNIADIAKTSINLVIGYFVGLPQVAAEVAKGIYRQFQIAFSNIGDLASAIPEALASFSTDPFKRVAASAAEEFSAGFSESVSGIGDIVSDSLNTDYIGDAASAASDAFSEFGERVSDTAFRLRFLNNDTEEAAKGLGSLGEAANDAEDDTENLSNTTKALTDAQKEAAKAAKKFEDALLKLTDSLNPLQASQRQYMQDQMLLQTAWVSGRITALEYFDALQKLNQAQLSSQTASEAYSGGFGSEIGSRGAVGSPTDPNAEEEDRWGIKAFMRESEETFSSFNSLSMSAAETFGSTFQGAFNSAISQADSLSDALSGIGNAIVNSIVAAIAQMAAEWIAFQALQLAFGETGAAKSEAQAVKTGSTIAAAYEPAAVAASLASFGTNAIGAIAGIGSTFAAMAAFSGMFDNGGNIASGKWGIVGERGPEIVRGPANVTSRLDTARIMSGGGSRVSSNRNAANDSGGGNVYVYNNSPNRVETTRDEYGNTEVRILEDLRTGGPLSQGMTTYLNTQRRLK